MITIELEPVADNHNIERHRGLADLTKRLADSFSDHRLAATWAVGDPAHSAATPTLLLADEPQEIAILGDPNWLGPTAGRTRFARELARRISQARAAQLDVATLVPRIARIDQHVDLIVKHGLSAVGGLATATDRGQQCPSPGALHYGVWEFPVTVQLPMKTSWWKSTTRTLVRQIRRAAKDAATFHLLINAPAIEEEGTKAEKTIHRLVREVAELRDRGLLRVETLGHAAVRLSDVPIQTPQRSILRRAG